MVRVLVIIAVLLWPLLHVMFSTRVQGNAKYTWLTVVLLTSWIGYLVFLIKMRSPDGDGDGPE